MLTLEQLEIADEPADWRALGFDVEDGVCQVSSVRLRLVGKGPRRGILGWTLTDDEPVPTKPAPHPNGVARIDHVVLMSPDLDRTVADLRSEGFGLRRIREGETPGGSTRQAFFRVGEPILEVVQAPEGTSVARTPDGLHRGRDGAARGWSCRGSLDPAHERRAVRSGQHVVAHLVLDAAAADLDEVTGPGPGQDARAAALADVDRPPEQRTQLRRG